LPASRRKGKEANEMPVHIPRPDSRLADTFCRDAKPPQTMIARDGANAWGHAIALFTQHEELRPGDTLTVSSLPESDLVAFGPFLGGAP
jgi:hypothetical protein